MSGVPGKNWAREPLTALIEAESAAVWLRLLEMVPCLIANGAGSRNQVSRSMPEPYLGTREVGSERKAHEIRRVVLASRGTLAGRRREPGGVTAVV